MIKRLCVNVDTLITDISIRTTTWNHWDVNIAPIVSRLKQGMNKIFETTHVTQTGPRSVKELIDLIGDGETPEYIFFWGHSSREPHPGCFSNWFPLKFEYNGLDYPSAEHFMMMEKARCFGDNHMLAKMNTGRLTRAHPGHVKALGRQVRNFDQDVWEAHIWEPMVDALVNKFSQHDEFMEYILSTGDAVLVEASPYDRVWGIGMLDSDEGINDPRNWKGRNLLGFVLMEARDIIRTMEV